MKYKVETFDRWQYLCGKSYQYDPLIRCRIDFDGHIDADLLIRAITLSLQTIPLIGLCFDGGGLKPRWVDKGFSGKDIVRIVGAPKNADSLILQCFSDNIDFAAEPQLKVFVIREDEKDTLCVTISHIVCDGAGFKRYLYLVSDLYTKLQSGDRLPTQSFEPRGTKPLFAGVGLKEKIHILRSDMGAYITAENQVQKGIDLGSGEALVYMKRRILSKAHFFALKAYAKAHGTTLNDGLMALFARAFCKGTGAERVMIPSTMDLRKLIPPDKSYGITNYSSGCMCDISVDADDTLAATIQQVSEQMRIHKTGNVILKSVLLWNIFARFPYPTLKRLYPKIIKQPIVSYTNLGIIDAKLLKFGDLTIREAYLTPAIKPRPYFQLNVSTYDNRCTLRGFGRMCGREISAQ